MLKLLLYTLIFGITFFQLNAQNCPGYSTTATGSGQACGDQIYALTVENTVCNGQIYFTITGSLSAFGDFDVESNQSGATVASGSTFWGSTINQSIGPLDPNVHGTVYKLSVDGGNITISQNGNTLANVTGGHLLFNVNITISPATISIQTPSGNVTRTVNNCKDFIVPVPLSNTNFCNTLNVSLPWEIKCDISGAVLSSGIHAVVVNPQVSTDPADLVDITWNSVHCEWDVSANFDCATADIGTIFNISPDPTLGPADVCTSGNELFTVDYVGSTGVVSCCETAGPLTPITYEETVTTTNVVPAISPFFAGSNHSAYINFSPSNTGGNATSIDLCIAVTNFCFNFTDNYYWVFIYVDGNTVYSQGFPTGADMNVCLDLSDIPGYDQSSNVEVYVLPNNFSVGSTTTLFTPNKTCGNLLPGNWTANFTSSIDVTFQEEIGSPVSCSGEITAAYTSCGITQPTIASETPADCNGPSTLNVTNYDNTATYTISPTGASIDGSGIISGDAGDYTLTVDNGVCTNEVVFTIDPILPGILPTFDAVADFCENTTSPLLPSISTNGINGTWSPALINNSAGTSTYTFTPNPGECGTAVTMEITVFTAPPFTLSSIHPTGCGVADGSIILGGLLANTNYSISYQDASGNTVGPVTLTSNGAGNISVGNLGSGSYTSFVVDLNGCVGINSTVINLVPTGSPVINAGQDVQVCVGELVTLTAFNPEGAIISWNNGGIDGQPFLPNSGTTNYTVTANLLGCISSDHVSVTVVPDPIINAGNDISVCEGQQVTLNATGALTYKWDNGAVNGQSFTPPSGTTVYTVTGINAIGCEGVDQVRVIVTNALDVSFAVDKVKGCSPLVVNFSNTSLSSGTCTYTLGDGTVLNGCNPTHAFTQPGCHDVTLTVVDNLGCSGSVTEPNIICVDAQPIASFVANPSALGIFNDEVKFTNTSVGADTYHWSFGDDTYSNGVNPTHQYELDKDQYIVNLVAISEFGCIDSISTVIAVEEELIYYVPNSFTPDGNHVNQVFKPIFTSGFNPMDYHLIIFNRWGEIVFESFDSDQGWDGSYGVNGLGIVKEGVYVYKIEFDRSRDDERVQVFGQVTLLR